MFLNYGAGLHGHEFSGSHKTRNHNFSLTRNTFIPSSLVPYDRKLERNSIDEDLATISSQPNRSSSELPRAVETTARFQETTQDYESDMSDGERSIANSVNSSNSRNRKLRQQKREPRKSSVFHLAHPAPTLTQTQKLLQIRPKIILQLQLISTQSRPKPSIDVLPSTVFIPRLARKFPRLLRGNSDLGSNDVIVVRSEDYGTSEDGGFENSDIDEDGLANQDLIAVICQIPRAKGTSLGVAEIVFSDGSVCKAIPLPGGLYEFTIKDEEGKEITANWWIKRYPKRKNPESSGYADVNADLRYAFSIINPNSKRHPIMATITHKNLEILDSYTTLSSSSGRYPPTSVIRDGYKDFRDKDEKATLERTTHEVDEWMKRLIQVTGIWVSLRQNWSPYFKYSDALAVACSSANSQSGKRHRASSLTVDTGRPRSAIYSPNTPDSILCTKATTLGNTIRRVSVRSKSDHRKLSHSEADGSSETAVSAGTAILHRTAAHRASYSPCTISRDKEEENSLKMVGNSVTENMNIHKRNPNGHSFPNRSMTTTEMTADVSSKAHRRTQSTYCPPSTSLYNDFNSKSSVRNKNGISVLEYSDIRHRNRRWKLITGFFRRMNLASSRPEN